MPHTIKLLKWIFLLPMIVGSTSALAGPDDCQIELTLSKDPEIRKLQPEEIGSLCGQAVSSEGPLLCLARARKSANLDWLSIPGFTITVKEGDEYEKALLHEQIRVCSGAKNAAPVECVSDFQNSPLNASLREVFQIDFLRRLCNGVETRDQAANCLRQKIGAHQIQTQDLYGCGGVIAASKLNLGH